MTLTPKLSMCCVQTIDTYDFTDTFYFGNRFMGQVTIYPEDEIGAKMAASAKAMKLSKSKWISNVIREKQACRYLVKDFGTSQSPKSTRQRDSLDGPGRPAGAHFATPSRRSALAT